jgi:hypothetical protein
MAADFREQRLNIVYFWNYTIQFFKNSLERFFDSLLGMECNNIRQILMFTDYLYGKQIILCRRLPGGCNSFHIKRSPV